MKSPFRSRSQRTQVRAVLLDASFIGALIATDSPDHVDACRVYTTLVERYHDGLDRLFALSDVLGDLPKEFRRGALAPVLTLRTARQHRSAARRIADRSTEVALSLVMMRRERLRAVATMGNEFDDIDVEVLSAQDGPISSETEPTSALQSTDG